MNILFCGSGIVCSSLEPTGFRRAVALLLQVVCDRSNANAKYRPSVCRSASLGFSRLFTAVVVDMMHHK